MDLGPAPFSRGLRAGNRTPGRKPPASGRQAATAARPRFRPGVSAATMPGRPARMRIAASELSGPHFRQPIRMKSADNLPVSAGALRRRTSAEKRAG